MIDKFKFIPILILIILTNFTIVHAVGSSKFYGDTELKDQSYKNGLEIMGSLSFTNLKVKGTTQVYGHITNEGDGFFDIMNVEGMANLSNVEIGELNVFGEIKGEQLTITSQMHIYGPAYIKDSTIEKIELVAGSVSSFENCKIEELIINDSLDSKVQTVILSGNTIIDKDIIFKSSQGLVIIRGKEVKIKAVVGGLLKYEDSPNLQN